LECAQEGLRFVPGSPSNETRVGLLPAQGLQQSPGALHRGREYEQQHDPHDSQKLSPAAQPERFQRLRYGETYHWIDQSGDSGGARMLCGIVLPGRAAGTAPPEAKVQIYKEGFCRTF